MKTTFQVFWVGLLSVGSLSAATITHNLNVEIIQVLSDSGADPSPLDPTNNANRRYVYEAQVNEIWNQAGIQVTFTYSTWNNTEAQRLTSTEMSALFGNTFTSTTGDVLPTIGVDRLQIFFIWDHPGTGYNGSENSGWKNDGAFNPATSAQNAGIAELYIHGAYSSNGRAVMANRGFAADQLAGTLAHEIGHNLGLRHVEDVNNGIASGSLQDPNYGVVPVSEYNLMWGAGNGPAYSSTLDNSPGLTVLQENYFLRPEQIQAAIYNGTRLDPDGNGTGVLQVIPEPSSALLLMLGGVMTLRRRK